MLEHNLLWYRFVCMPLERIMHAWHYRPAIKSLPVRCWHGFMTSCGPWLLIVVEVLSMWQVYWCPYIEYVLQPEKSLDTRWHHISPPVISMLLHSFPETIAVWLDLGKMCHFVFTLFIVKLLLLEHSSILFHLQIKSLLYIMVEG